MLLYFTSPVYATQSVRLIFRYLITLNCTRQITQLQPHHVLNFPNHRNLYLYIT